MFDFITDPSTTVYTILIVAAVGGVVYWYRTQTKGPTRFMAVAVGLLAILFILDIAVESPRQQAVRRVKAMVAILNDQDPARLGEHVADDFQYRSVNKDQIVSSRLWRQAMETELRFAVWDFDRSAVQRPAKDRISIGFQAKVATGGYNAFFFVRAEFVAEADGAWRLVGFKLFSDPLKKDQGQEFTPPGV